MPIYEFRCEDCGRISEFLILKKDESLIPYCKKCKSKNMTKIISKIRIVRSEESRLESLADPSKWGDLDENDPKSIARFMKKMGKEIGEDMEGIDEALEEEMSSRPDEKSLSED